MSSELLIIFILGASLVPAKAGSVSSTAGIAWGCFGAVVVLFILGALYARHRRTVRSRRPQDGDAAVPKPVNAWTKAAPPKDNGRAAGFGGGGVPTGEWERDA